MQFYIEESKSYEWFEGVVQSYDKRASMLSTSVVMMKLFVDSDESDIEIVE